MSEQLIGLPELLRMLPVTRQTIWRWHRAGKFPKPVCIGAKPAWVRAEVDAWIDARKAARP